MSQRAAHSHDALGPSGLRLLKGSARGIRTQSKNAACFVVNFSLALHVAVNLAWEFAGVGNRVSSVPGIAAVRLFLQPAGQDFIPYELIRRVSQRVSHAVHEGSGALNEGTCGLDRS
jgi:hypothetical protein